MNEYVQQSPLGTNRRFGVTAGCLIPLLLFNAHRVPWLSCGVGRGVKRQDRTGDGVAFDYVVDSIKGTTDALVGNQSLVTVIPAP